MSWLTPEIVELLAPGLAFTVSLTVITSITSLLAGILVGSMRLSTRSIARRLSTIYIELFRNIPALVLIIFFAFALPNLIPLEARQHFFFDNALTRWGQSLTGLSLPYYMLAAIVALTLNTSAYLAELFRAGTRSIPLEYVDAARSLGATPAAVFWQILLPQGFRAAFPAVTTRLIHNMKNTALVAFVAVPDFFHATQTAIARTFRATEFLILAAIMYLLLSIAFAAFLRWVEGRMDRQPPPESNRTMAPSLGIGEG